jgi:hypothetical protein
MIVSNEMVIKLCNRRLIWAFIGVRGYGLVSTLVLFENNQGTTGISKPVKNGSLAWEVT